MSRRGIAFDWPLVSVALLLSLYGIAMVYSAGQVDVGVTYVTGAWIRQAAWFGLALVSAAMLSRSSTRFLEWVSWPAYLFTLFLLIVTLAFGSGAGTAASVKGWLTIGGVRLGQPAELAKPVTVLMLARILTQRREQPKSLLDLWRPVLVVAVPWLLIMLQPDLGSGLAFIGILFAMLFWAGVPWQMLALLASPAVSLVLSFNTAVWGIWFLLLVGLVVWYKPYLAEGVTLVVANVVMGVLAPLLWDALKPYQQRRLLVFLDPMNDPRASGYHVIQSQVAIGSGGWFGKGWTLGTQKRLAFLPAQHTDFIFAVVGEEMGFIGVCVALTLFLALLLRCTRIASRATDAFSSLAAFGLLASWFVHVVVNIGMTLNLMPITGIPLPFFSYGGSFMLISWLAIGVLARFAAEGRGRTDGLAI
ncbi:rod shape-determining protein RodA [Roseisolibacter sp. H3M3-2]|uniref:rod shape-determining protein RodA n=1 Tax=Roseisolibacter sp. H3M3-2 TaxID=3031323 RepID=UPI0023DA8698|nr:rod shape-determining protein RodA [Roseisolibacter sp. H3M3-2]MDF1501505.1 rod shape-determining protein RodA [Roseisolibacter sp. H3M3-2]